MGAAHELPGEAQAQIKIFWFVIAFEIYYRSYA
mgnify:CR=1 FL=1